MAVTFSSAASAGSSEKKIELPPGVEGPQSQKRLKPTVPDGHISLNGYWLCQKDPEGIGEKDNWHVSAEYEGWDRIYVPGCWQAQGLGLDYHGVVWYRRIFRLPKQWMGRQIWLHFGAVATHAKVWINGNYAGEHIGNWTPFDLRITDFVEHEADNNLVVRVEELPNHTSSGFPKHVGMHFGGIWQPVSLFSTGNLRLEDVFVRPYLKNARALVETHVSSITKASGELFCTVIGPDGTEVARASKKLEPEANNAKFDITIPNPKPWSPESPMLYEVRLSLWSNGKLSDFRSVSFGLRDVTIRRHQIFLNGKPLYIRGMLHWGYYPHLITIDPSEEQIRREFRDLRAAGFNMVKICLFLMPKRFYEIADETGMLLWQEYPVWQTFPKTNQTGDREALAREYEQWFKFERNHPSVVVRDLTCEAPDPDPEFSEHIYKLAKSMTGGALICDNSAYLNQKFTDFFDCHLYNELDDLYKGLPNQVIPWLRGQENIKPYLSGEDFDIDTYKDTSAILRKWVRDGNRPWWINNGIFSSQEQFEKELVERYGQTAPKRLVRNQNRRAIAIRKALIEEFRRYQELGGYVMTHIRDIPITNPGFYDDLEEPKWTSEEWRRFTDDCVLILYSPRRSFCFTYGEKAEMQIELSNYGGSLYQVPLRWQLRYGKQILTSGQNLVDVPSGKIAVCTSITLDKLPFKDSNVPRKCTLFAELGKERGITRNEWPVWFFPEVRDELNPASVIIADNLNEPTLKALSDGARVLYLPNDEDAAIPRINAPFWREMAVWVPNEHPALGDFPHEGFADLQFYYMTQRNPFDTRSFRNQITPIVWGINARFGPNLVVDYVFEARVQKGRLLACCLKLHNQEDPACRYLLRQLLKYAASEQFQPSETLDLNLR
ncbi:MAG: hypothetical protein N3B12_05800 [Armatimonadetes bacterium]|nr:hypothetical protein [Armatimonadota bacterium]